MDRLASVQFDPTLIPEAPIGLINKDSTKQSPYHMTKLYAEAEEEVCAANGAETKWRR